MLNHLSLQSQNLDLYGMRGNPMTLVQNRIFPWTTLYLGSNLWLSTPAIQQGRILFPANFQSWQVTAGVNVTLFEKRFKDEKRERKEAKKQARSAKVLNSGTAELNPLKLQDHSDLLSDTINEEGDGVVISSLYSRDHVSVFGKPVKNHASEHGLSEEEKESLDEARKNLKAQMTVLE